MPRRGGPLHPVGSVEAIVSVEALPLGFEIDGTERILFFFFSFSLVFWPDLRMQLRRKSS
jgi:hypothetical protein